MFDSISNTGEQELLKARLAQAEASLRGTPVTTREDLLATVYSRLNAVLALGNNVTPLLPVAREGPAIAGDLNGNFRILNQDAQAIIKQLIGTENDAATLFNLFASTQNNLRQAIREVVYTSGARRYREEFINNTKLGACTATVDFNAGVVALPLVAETFVQPTSIDFGVACEGALCAGSTDLLLDDHHGPLYRPQSCRSIRTVPKQTKPKVGRPKLPNGDAKGRIVPVRFNPYDLKRIEQAARASQKTVSEWIRGTITSVMEAQ